MADDIITRDSQGNLAVNTVSSTEADVAYNYDDCFTLDTNGRRALRVVDSGGAGGLPDQTGNSGKVLTTNGTDASWANITASQLASITGLADGNYVLRATIADGVATLSWVSE